jgi:hypothetical protein
MRWAASLDIVLLKNTFYSLSVLMYFFQSYLLQYNLNDSEKSTLKMKH